MSVYFGGLWLLDKAETSGFMVVGAPGTGKTLLLRMTMKSVFDRFSEQEDARAVVADIKGDMVSLLLGMGIDEEQLCLMNPWDRRCHEWNMALDVKGPDVALQIATNFIPEENSQNRYFSDAARDLLCGVLSVFIEKGREKQKRDGTKADFTLADVIFAMRSPRHLHHVLSQTAAGRDLIQLHLSAGEASVSVLSTARSRLAALEVPAALWRHAGKLGRRMSLQKFLKHNGGVLVLGNNQKAVAPMQAINRILFMRLSQLVLDQSESRTRRNWFFLDELTKLAGANNQLEGLDALMRIGRSKGGAICIAFQDIAGLYAAFGKMVADEIVAMCSSFMICKVSGSVTPEWASELCGDQELRELLLSEGSSNNLSPQGLNISTDRRASEQIRQPRNFIASQFRALPLPEEGEPLHAFCHTPFIPQGNNWIPRWLRLSEQKRRGAVSYEAAIPPEEIAEMLDEPAHADYNFMPWLGEDGEEDETIKTLLPWDEDDYQRLNIPILSDEDDGDGDDDDGDDEEEGADDTPPDDAPEDSINDTNSNAGGSAIQNLGGVLFPDLSSAKPKNL